MHEFEQLSPTLPTEKQASDRLKQVALRHAVGMQENTAYGYLLREPLLQSKSNAFPFA